MTFTNKLTLFSDLLLFTLVDLLFLSYPELVRSFVCNFSILAGSNFILGGNKIALTNL